MKGGHYAIAAGVIGAFALQVAGLHTWHDATSPAFVSGVLVSISSTILALYTDRPGSGKDA